MIDILTLETKSNEINNIITRKKTEVSLLEEECVRLRQNIEVNTQLTEKLNKAKTLLEVVAKASEAFIKDSVEPLINDALLYVFEQELHFHMIFQLRRNQIETDFVIFRSQEHEDFYQAYMNDSSGFDENAMDELIKQSKDINYFYGGAVNQVLSAILKIVVYILNESKGPLFFDEPTSMTSEIYAARLGKFLSSISEKFNLQIILATHSPALAGYANRVYNIEKIGMDTQINDITEVEKSYD